MSSCAGTGSPFTTSTLRFPLRKRERPLCPRGADLEKIFSHQQERVVGNDNTVSFGKRVLQIKPQKFRFSLARCRVLVCQHLDETLSLYYGPHLLGRYDAQRELLTARRKHRQKKVA